MSLLFVNDLLPKKNQANETSTVTSSNVEMRHLFEADPVKGTTLDSVSETRLMEEVV